MVPDWLRWGKELQAIAQIGLSYSGESHFDAERYGRIREIAAEMLSSHGGVGERVLLEIFRTETGYATPKVATSAETSEVAFFGEHELPDLSLSRVTPAEIRRAFEHLRNPQWPPDLD